MTRKLPFWATLCTVSGVIVLCGLGSWQVQRLEWKNALLETLEAQYSKPAPEIKTITTDLDLKRAEITGSFLNKEAIALQPRTHDGKPGSHMLYPFRLKSGELLLINRGWAPLNITEVEPSTRKQTLTGLFRTPAKANMFVPKNQPEKNAWYRYDLNEIADYYDLKDLKPYVFYAETRTDEDLTPVGTMPELNNNHLQYAGFWFCLAITLIAVYVLRFVRKQTP